MDQISDKQDAFLEWHANEGAVELLVPYRDFIPRFAQELQAFRQESYATLDIKGKLSDFYQVSYKVIENRIENLNYEIDQYISGVDIDHIRILSRKQQYKYGIDTPSYNTMCKVDANPLKIVDDIQSIMDMNPESVSLDQILLSDVLII